MKLLLVHFSFCIHLFISFHSQLIKCVLCIEIFFTLSGLGCIEWNRMKVMAVHRAYRETGTLRPLKWCLSIEMNVEKYIQKNLIELFNLMQSNSHKYTQQICLNTIFWSFFGRFRLWSQQMYKTNFFSRSLWIYSENESSWPTAILNNQSKFNCA